MNLKLFLFSFCLALITISNGQTIKINGQFTCEVQSDTIFLAENIGGKYSIIDQSKIDKEGKFSFLGSYPTGYYAIWEKPDNYAQIIINQENISLEFKDTLLRKSIRIIESEENFRLWDFIKKRQKKKSEIAQIYMQKTEFKQNSIEYLYFDSIENKYKEDYNRYILNINSKYPNSFFAKSVLSDIEVNNKAEYFKYVDFNNTDLIRSGSFTKKITDFLQYHTNYTEDGFIESIDQILMLASTNKLVYDFVLNYLLELFNAVGPDVILNYLIEEYVIGDACSDLDLSTVLNNKLNAYKKINIGNKAPNISTFSIDGIIRNLHDICSFSKISILYFGSSHCSFCKDSNPKLIDLISNNKNSLQLIYISLDTSFDDWKEFVKNKPENWISLSELKGWDSKSTEIFQVHKTPSFYILDNNSIILSKPGNIDELIEETNMLTHKKKAQH